MPNQQSPQPSSREQVQNQDFSYFNVADEFKNMSVEDIKACLAARSLPGAVAMMQLKGDFNFSSVVRNANAFGITKVFYVGDKKHWDRRGAVGTHNYIDVVHYKSFEDMVEANRQYHLVALENNTDYQCTNIYEFNWPVNIMLLIGEEGQGLPRHILTSVQDIVYIPQYGSVRSINAATAAGIALSMYAQQHQG